MLSACLACLVVQAAPSGALDTAKNFLDKLLIADFFAVLAILLWLGAGVAAKVTTDSSVRARDHRERCLAFLSKSGVDVLAALGGCQLINDCRLHCKARLVAGRSRRALLVRRRHNYVATVLRERVDVFILRMWL
jgi:hypothetical protein